MLPALVVRARFSPRLSIGLCFDSSLDLWRDLSPLLTVRENTDAVTGLTFVLGIDPMPHQWSVSDGRGWVTDQCSSCAQYRRRGMSLSARIVPVISQ